MFALAGAMLLVCAFTPPPHGGTAAGVLMQLPDRLSIFIGKQESPGKVESDLLPTDTQFAKMVYSTDTADVSKRDVARVSIVLAGAESRSIHRPEVCLTGQGWTITGSTVTPVEISPGRILQVKDLAIEGSFVQRDGTSRQAKAHYVYWFVGTDFSTPSHFERLWHSTWDAVLRNINHRWAYVSVLAMVTDGMDVSQTGERHRTDDETKRLINWFIQRLVPEFQKDFMPKQTRSP